MNTAHKVGSIIISNGVLLASYCGGIQLHESNTYPLYKLDSNEQDHPEDVVYVVSETSGVHSTSVSGNPMEDSSEQPSIANLEHTEAQVDLALKHSASAEPVNLSVSKLNQPYEEIITQEVKTGDSFISLAKQSGVKTEDLTSLLYQSRISKSIFKLSQNQKIEFFLTEGDLSEVAIYDLDETYISLTRTADRKFTKSIKSLPIISTDKVHSFTIQSSLSIDGHNSGLSSNSIAQIHETLRHKVNFETLPQGAQISALYTSKSVNGRILSSKLVAVNLTSNGKTHYAYFYKDDHGTGFYDQNGVSVLPSFLRHPIKDPIITSHFNLNRKHPILNVTRPHWGTDYGHWKGTPILAISDAVVKFAGKKGGFGNAVILKHPSGIETLSAHMSKFAKGIRTGVKVKKGQVVGYVGKTGLSTGYHLHFELKKDGKRVSSLKVDLPTIEKVSSIKDYALTKDLYQKQLDS